MIISDLSYFENVSENELIVGGSLLGIASSTSAEGDNTYTLAGANTEVKTIGNGNVTKGTGTGEALAIGSNPEANVDVYSKDFKIVNVIENPHSGTGDNYAYEGVRVIAIDPPSAK